MLKRDVREMVSYLISERKSFKVVFANDKVEVVEYRGYCWVLGNKGYSDEDLVKKMVKFQDNVSKFIIRLEVIEEVEEVEEETSIEVSLVEEVENLTDDLFQEEDLAYCEEVIERESNKKEIGCMFKKELLKSLIGEKVIISVMDYDGEFVIDKEYSILTEEDFEYYSSDNFILDDHEEISANVYKIYLEVVE